MYFAKVKVGNALKLNRGTRNESTGIVLAKQDGKISVLWNNESGLQEYNVHQFNRKANVLGMQVLEEEYTIKFQKVEPNNFNAWDDIEVSAVCKVDEENVETCEESEADFYSVYLHQKEGGVVCVADLPTKEEAEKLGDLILNAAKSYNPTR
jgi:hypothetical protein